MKLTDFAHASPETLTHPILVVVASESNDDGLSVLLLDILVDYAGCLDAIHHRHEDVHEDEPVPATARSFPSSKGLLEGLFAIVGLRCEAELTVSQPRCRRSR